jgi:hypothetical protein
VTVAHTFLDSLSADRDRRGRSKFSGAMVKILLAKGDGMVDQGGMVFLASSPP